MELRQLGRTGLRTSALGFGCGAVGGLMVRGGREEQMRAVARALEAGINYFDTAPSYGNGASETNLGHALRELGVRHRVLVGTKVRLTVDELDQPAAAARRSLEQSLARLGLERVDVVHLHNPIDVQTADPADAGVSAAAAQGEVAEGLRRLVDDGLAGHLGFTAVGATAALRRMAEDTHYETAQAYLNVLNPSGVRSGAAGGQQDFEGLIGHASGHATGVIAIRVYAAGALTATAERHPTAWLPTRPLIPGSDYARDVERARRLQQMAASSGTENLLELGLRFAMSVPGVSTALVGLSSYDHLASAVRWAERGSLPAEAVDRLLEMAAG